MPIRAEISAVAMDPNHKVPVVLLKPENDERFVPIWIGMMEASAILVAMEDVESPRPMTHDLLCLLLSWAGASVERVEVVDLRDGTYFAELTVERDGMKETIDCRPSDAMAIALRTKAEIYIHERVLDKVQLDDGTEVEADEATDAEEPQLTAAVASEVDEDAARKILEELDPDDFKYKM